jgi:hypothetical protein
MSETSASKSAFDPETFCECQKCFSIHRKGSVAQELKPAAAVTPAVDPKKCEYCGGMGLRLGNPARPELGYTKCNHQPPQGEMPF